MKIDKYIRVVVASVLLFSPVGLFSQIENIKSPAISDFSGVLAFLSSGWMEGRESGERGSFIASDYIASMMEVSGLKPYGDKTSSGRSYFQTFDLIRYKIKEASLSVITETESSELSKRLTHQIDFEVISGVNGIEAETPILFAGYGISAPGLGYDDYDDLNVKGSTVIILDGFPGHLDTASPGFIKLAESVEEKSGADAKLKEVMKRGAAAVIRISGDGKIEPYRYSQSIRSFLKSAMNADKFADPGYEYFEYALPEDIPGQSIPTFKLSKEAAEILFAGTGIDLAKVEETAANKIVSSSRKLKKVKAEFSISVSAEPIVVRNVLGIIPGKDETKNIVIGAHYDHLGIRNGEIYNGSDDNASGCAGMLASAKLWKAQKESPQFNLIFAAWTAEEVGHFGSIYCVNHYNLNPGNTLLNINFDMLSRSAPEDSTGTIVSVGTLKGGDELKSLAVENNSALQNPLILDLWEASEHGGSDYASFAAKKIPVMTFFSGFNEDYHSIRDISIKADLLKMETILNLANRCLVDFIEIKSQD